MSEQTVIAIIAAFAPTVAAVLSYVAQRRSLRRSLGPPSDVPVAELLGRLEAKVDALSDGQAAMRERLARLEGGLASRRRGPVP